MASVGLAIKLINGPDKPENPEFSRSIRSLFCFVLDVNVNQLPVSVVRRVRRHQHVIYVDHLPGTQSSEASVDRGFYLSGNTQLSHITVPWLSRWKYWGILFYPAVCVSPRWICHHPKINPIQCCVSSFFLDESYSRHRLFSCSKPIFRNTYRLSRYLCTANTKEILRAGDSTISE